MQKILLVDDEREFSMVLGDRLEDEGYSVVTAFDGKSALDTAKAEQPDIILLDIILPDMDGNIVAGKLRETPGTRDIPIIFLTGLLSQEEAAKRGSSIAGSVFVAKSAKMGALFAEIKKLLNRSK